MIRNLVIGGASTEDISTLGASSLRDAEPRIRPLITQERIAEAHLKQELQLLDESQTQHPYDFQLC